MIIVNQEGMTTILKRHPGPAPGEAVLPTSTSSHPRNVMYAAGGGDYHGDSGDYPDHRDKEGETMIIRIITTTKGDRGGNGIPDRNPGHNNGQGPYRSGGNGNGSDGGSRRGSGWYPEPARYLRRQDFTGRDDTLAEILQNQHEAQMETSRVIASFLKTQEEREADYIIDDIPSFNGDLMSILIGYLNLRLLLK